MPRGGNRDPLATDVAGSGSGGASQQETELDPSNVRVGGVRGFQPMTWDWAVVRGLTSFRRGYWPWRGARELGGKQGISGGAGNAWGTQGNIWGGGEVGRGPPSSLCHLGSVLLSGDLS